MFCVCGTGQCQQGYRTFNTSEGTQQEKELAFAARQLFLNWGRLYFVDNITLRRKTV